MQDDPWLVHERAEEVVGDLVEERRLSDAQRKIGELSMDLDILRALNEEMDRRPRSPRR